MTIETFGEPELDRFLNCNARLQSWPLNTFILSRPPSVLRVEFVHSYPGVVSMIDRLAQGFNVFAESHARFANPEHPESYGAHVDEETVQLLPNNAGAYGGSIAAQQHAGDGDGDDVAAANAIDGYGEDGGGAKTVQPRVEPSNDDDCGAEAVDESEQPLVFKRIRLRLFFAPERIASMAAVAKELEDLYGFELPWMLLAQPLHFFPNKRDDVDILAYAHKACKISNEYDQVGQCPPPPPKDVKGCGKIKKEEQKRFLKEAARANRSPATLSLAWVRLELLNVKEREASSTAYVL